MNLKVTVVIALLVTIVLLSSLVALGQIHHGADYPPIELELDGEKKVAISGIYECGGQKLYVDIPSSYGENKIRFKSSSSCYYTIIGYYTPSGDYESLISDCQMSNSAEVPVTPGQRVNLNVVICKDYVTRSGPAEVKVWVESLTPTPTTAPTTAPSTTTGTAKLTDDFAEVKGNFPALLSDNDDSTYVRGGLGAPTSDYEAKFTMEVQETDTLKFNAKVNCLSGHCGGKTVCGFLFFAKNHETGEYDKFSGAPWDPPGIHEYELTLEDASKYIRNGEVDFFFSFHCNMDGYVMEFKQIGGVPSYTAPTAAPIEVTPEPTLTPIPVPTDIVVTLPDVITIGPGVEKCVDYTIEYKGSATKKYSYYARIDDTSIAVFPTGLSIMDDIYKLQLKPGDIRRQTFDVKGKKEGETKITVELHDESDKTIFTKDVRVVVTTSPVVKKIMDVKVQLDRPHTLGMAISGTGIKGTDTWENVARNELYKGQDYFKTAQDEGFFTTIYKMLSLAFTGLALDAHVNDLPKQFKDLNAISLSELTSKPELISGFTENMMNVYSAVKAEPDSKFMRYMNKGTALISSGGLSAYTDVCDVIMNELEADAQYNIDRATLCYSMSYHAMRMHEIATKKDLKEEDVEEYFFHAKSFILLKKAEALLNYRELEVTLGGTGMFSRSSIAIATDAVAISTIESRLAYLENQKDETEKYLESLDSCMKTMDYLEKELWEVGA